MLSFRKFWVDSWNKDIDRLLNNPLIKKLMKDLTKKEVKKVNKLPYFETKAVKVKKHKHEETGWHKGKYITAYKCNKCGQIVGGINNQPKGNWVNGENLDAIKFPCFCSFETSMRDYKRLGELDLINYYALTFFRLRELVQIDRKLVYKCEFYRPTLEDMIKTFDIHILKGKILIWEEEE